MKFKFPTNGEFDTKVAKVIYAYADRKNGWFYYKANAAGDQIGDAVYCYTKTEAIVGAADEASKYIGVDAIRG